MIEDMEAICPQPTLKRYLQYQWHDEHDAVTVNDALQEP